MAGGRGNAGRAVIGLPCLSEDCRRIVPVKWNRKAGGCDGTMPGLTLSSGNGGSIVVDEGETEARFRPGVGPRDSRPLPDCSYGSSTPGLKDRRYHRA